MSILLGLVTVPVDQFWGSIAGGGGGTIGSPALHFKVLWIPLPSYTIERVPRVLEHVLPSGSTSGFVYTPPGADHRLVFSLLDPSFGNEDSALVDLAVAFKFSPFEKNGGPDTGGPCG